MKKRRRACRPAQTAAQQSQFVLVSLPPHAVALFRFLLEAYEHLAYFSVLNRYEAILQVFFSPHREKSVMEVLTLISQSIKHTCEAELRIIPRPQTSFITHEPCRKE